MFSYAWITSEDNPDSEEIEEEEEEDVVESDCF
jgi:hypothetical protein